MPVFESGLLYRVRMDLKEPCEFLQIRTEPDPIDGWTDHKKLKRMILLAPDRKHILQTFPELIEAKNALGMNPFDASRIQYDDFNFDGYRDFRIHLPNAGGVHEHISWYYLFDPQTHRYVISKELNDILPDSFDQQRKTFNSYDNEGGGTYGSATFKWMNGKVVEIFSAWHDLDKAKGYFTQYDDHSDSKHPRKWRIYDSERKDESGQ